MSYYEYKDQKLASKNRLVVAIVSFLLPPVGYWLVGRTGLAVICLFTGAFVLTGIVIVPIHTWVIISGARKRAKMSGAAESS